QWIKDPLFDYNISQNWTSSKSGDIRDIELTEDIGYVNYIVIGDNNSASYINNPPLDSNWTKMRDPDHPQFPEDTTTGSENADSGIDGDGAFAYHTWDENVGNQLGQDPGVLWKRNITLPVNISDYTITSAVLSTIINASPIKVPAGQSPENKTEGSEQGRGDYVYFFIRISDLSGNYTYEVANYINEGDFYLPDSPMNNVTESDLIFYLSSVIQDGCNFTITMGINFWCEDNEWTDVDEWEHARIKSLNLSLSYQKKINPDTHAYWSQTSDLFNGRPFIINEAKLYFQYKIDSKWPLNDSPNSEFKININNNTHSETIKLSTANITFEDAKPGGFNVIPILVKNAIIKLSLEVYLADEFILADNLTMSIDNVTLYINRTILNQTAVEEEGIPPLFIPPGPDWTPVVYLLIAIIAGVLVVFGAYQGYFKYPPTIRKIRKLKKKIKKRKAKKPITISKRDLIIQSQLQNQLKTIEFEKISKGKSLKK
ncbi:MAG: hypothetical protein ACFFDN_17400, partial [Candidatus Hodarchaeota archaeon]